MLKNVEPDEKEKWWTSITDGPVSFAHTMLRAVRYSYELIVPSGAPSPFYAVYHANAGSFCYFEITHPGWLPGSKWVLSKEKLVESLVEPESVKHAELVSSGARFTPVTKGGGSFEGILFYLPLHFVRTPANNLTRSP